MSCTISYREGFEKYADSAALNAALGISSTSYDFDLELSETPFGEGKSAYYDPTNSLTQLMALPYDMSGDGGDIVGPYFICARFKLGPDSNESSILLAGCHQYIGSITTYANCALAYNSLTNTVSLRGDGWVGYGEVSIDLNDGEWHSLEFYFTCTTVGSMRGYIDGGLVLSADSADTYDNSTRYLGVFGGTEDFYVDDVIYGRCDAVTDRLGAGGLWQCVEIAVDADDGVNQWTPSTGADHYAMVDDPTPDGDATYLESSAAGQAEEFQLATFPASVGNVIALAVSAVVRGTDPGVSRAVEIYLKSNVTEEIVFGPWQITGTGYVNRQSAIAQEDPDTGVAWTKSGAQATTVGIRT